uniref:Nanos-type domain-containing protein n=1 Tax=Ditylenchus dipsaci TaxID=166011 RepID=A0A915EM53_9BILA
MVYSQDSRRRPPFQSVDQPIYSTGTLVRFDRGCCYYSQLVVVPPEPRNSMAHSDGNWRKKSTASENQVFHAEDNRIVCYFCQWLGATSTSHNMFDRGEVNCPRFSKRSGCPICNNKESSPHIEIDCPMFESKDKSSFIKAATEFKEREITPGYRESASEYRGNSAFNQPRASNRGGFSGKFASR